MHGAIQDPTEVFPVGSRSQMRQFIRYPCTRYRDDPNWVPPLLMAEKELFDRKNPFFDHARVELFIARSAGEVVGRVAAIDDDNHNRTHGDNLALFEAKDQDAALALLARVEGWAAALGRHAARGPANPSLNHSAGFVIDAFGTDPFVLMPYNPPKYPLYVESTGYAKVKDLYAWLFECGWDITRLGRLADRVPSGTMTW